MFPDKPFSPTVAARALIAALVLVSAAGPAQSRTVETRPGKTVQIANFHAWDRFCGSIKVHVDVTREPSHGVVVIHLTSSTKITRANRGSVHLCKGKRVKSVKVEYRPDPGFRGSDRFGINVRSGAAVRPVGYGYTVNVR